MSWCLDVILLNKRRALGTITDAFDLNAIINRFLNDVFKNVWIIVDELKSYVIDLHLIHTNESIHPIVNDYWGTFAHHKDIVKD